jgi:malate dehydrogenase
MESSTTLRVTVTGAAGQIGYSLIPLICSGQTFGPDVNIKLKLLDIEKAMDACKGVVMEINDCAYSLVKSIEYGHNPKEMLKGADVVFFVGGFPRLKGMERKDLIGKNISIFKEQGEALNEVASSNCKVLVVANPANTNCLALSKFCPNIPKENFTALTRLDHNRAQNQVAMKLGVDSKDIEDVVIWGNHSSTQYPDVRNVKVKGEKIDHDEHKDFWHGDFITTVQKRGAAIIEARGLSSAMSAAKAASDHFHDWYLGRDDPVSMCLVTDGDAYGVEKDLCFSFPVVCKGNFEYEIVKDIEIDEFSQEKIDITTQELKEEREVGELE